jgi:hypothetical protein
MEILVNDARKIHLDREVNMRLAANMSGVGRVAEARRIRGLYRCCQPPSPQLAQCLQFWLTSTRAGPIRMLRTFARAPARGLWLDSWFSCGDSVGAVRRWREIRR